MAMMIAIFFPLAKTYFNPTYSFKTQRRKNERNERKLATSSVSEWWGKYEEKDA